MFSYDPHSMSVAAVLTLGAAAFFLGMGVYGLAKPGAIVERFGMTASTPDGRA